jgi:hypothetical protein
MIFLKLTYYPDFECFVKDCPESIQKSLEASWCYGRSKLWGLLTPN